MLASSKHGACLGIMTFDRSRDVIYCCQQKWQRDLLRLFTHLLGFLFQNEGLVTEKDLVKLNGLWIIPFYTMILNEMSFYATPVW